jgi:hypothetical protein
MKTTWQIVAVADRVTDFRWIWEELRNGNVVARSAERFERYDECARDAHSRGYESPRVERLR